MRRYMDSYIEEYIKDLNQRGIVTLWSCSGLEEDHVGREEFMSAPYLVIELDSLSKEEVAAIATKMATTLFTAADIYGESIYVINIGMEKRLKNKEDVDYAFNQRVWEADLGMCGVSTDVYNLGADGNFSRVASITLRMTPFADHFRGDKEQMKRESLDNLYSFLSGLRPDGGVDE
jgi:hypothetical protein